MPKAQRRPSLNDRAKLFQKRRKSSTSSSPSTRGGPPSLNADQVEKTRNSIITNITERLKSRNGREDKNNPKELSESIENTVFVNNNESVNEGYKSSIRRILISLKDAKTGFKDQLLSGDLSATDFATLPVNELKSQERRNSDEVMRKEAIRLATLQEVLPEDVTPLDDGIEREKWGMGKSAARIDE